MLSPFSPKNYYFHNRIHDEVTVSYSGLNGDIFYLLYLNNIYMVTTAYILLCILFFSKIISAIYVVLFVSTKKIQETLTIFNIKSKKAYCIGILEHLFFLICVNILYWL